MKPSKLKKFDDSLIVAANTGKKAHHKKLRDWLRVIARHKRTGIPQNFLDELTRVNRLFRFQWWTPVPPSSVIGEVNEDDFIFKPHLAPYWVHWEHDEFDAYLAGLIQNLRDHDWVMALKECPGCGKLLLDYTKWKNRFCSPQCKKKDWARRHRQRITCPGLKEYKNKDKITLLGCREIQKEGPYKECQTCQYFIKKKGGITHENL